MTNSNNSDMPSLADMLAQHQQTTKEEAIEKFIADAKDRDRNFNKEDEESMRDYLESPKDQRGARNFERHVRDSEQMRRDIIKQREVKAKEESDRLANDGITDHGDGNYTDRYGRECDSKGNRY